MPAMSTDVWNLSPSAGRQRLQKWLATEWYSLAAGVVAAIVASAIFRGALHQGLESDFPPDLAFTAHGFQTGVFPGNFLFEILNFVFAGFSTATARLNVSLFLVLGLATGIKVWLSARFVVSEDAATSGSVARGPYLLGVIVAAVLCAFTFCLPAQNYYLGEMPPNVWHNPSTILLMPFAVGLFLASLSFLRDGDSKYLWISFILGILNIAAKPSFILCFLPIFPLAALLRFGLGRELYRAALLVLAIACVLGLQYIYVFVVDPSGSTLVASSGVTIAPLLVWKDYTTEIPRAILASYLFPAVALVLGGAAVRRNDAVRYALALAIVGLLEYGLLAERGARALEGNFTWQAIVTQYILFLALIASLIPWLRDRPWGIRQAIVVLTFGAYVWAGVHFLLHWFATKSYA
jgi:hypothetical protein